MLTTTARPYTPAEFDAYLERMDMRTISLTERVIVAGIAGALLTGVAFGLVWLYTLLFSGSAGWRLPLIVGGSGAAVVFAAGWFLGGGSDSWTEAPPELATDVIATADAAWNADSDSLEFPLVLRVEPDRYLIISQDRSSPPFHQEPSASDGSCTIPSCIQLVLLGEGEHRVALEVKLTGPAIPCPTVDAMPTAEDADSDEAMYVTEGLYSGSQLPRRIRVAIGLE
jgi:hypothetical protein